MMPSVNERTSAVEGSGTQRSAPFAALGRRLGRVGTGAVITAGLILLGFFWVNIIIPHTPFSTIPCPFETVTGYDCPGCGLQSSLVNLTQLRFKYVLMANLLSPVLLPLFYILVVSWTADTLFGVTLWRFRMPLTLIIVAILVLILYGITRNIPSLGVW